MGLFSNIKNILENIEIENKQNPKEDTVTAPIFDELKEQLDIIENEDVQSRLEKKIREIEAANRENPAEETAPKSVFDRIQDSIKKAIEEEGKTDTYEKLQRHKALWVQKRERFKAERAAWQASPIYRAWIARPEYIAWRAKVDEFKAEQEMWKQERDQLKAALKAERQVGRKAKRKR